MKTGWLRFVFLKHFSQPASDRPVLRLIDRGKISSITEFGLGQGVRMRRMIEICLAHHVPHDIRYAGFDQFESRPHGAAGLTLKQTHRELSALGIQLRLVPGEIMAGLIRSANTLTQTDLVVISREVDQSVLDVGWFYFPRMLHERSVVLLETGNVRPEFQLLNYAQVCELGRRAATAARRAA